jgi:hypothetical protein
MNKKNLIALILSLLVLACINLRAEENPTFPPIIDGEIEEIWFSTPLMPVEKVVPSFSPADTNDFKADVRMLWDAEHLYMLLVVRDDTIFNQAANIWDNDNVEIYLDLKNAGIAWAEGHKQLRLVAGDTTVHGFKNYGYGYTRSAGTYIMEIAIPFDSIMDGFAPQVGTVIGFDILVRDNDFGQITARGWNTTSYNIWQDMTLAGSIRFLENNRVNRSVPLVSPGFTNYYVSTEGNNENSGLDPANAFRTIQHAAAFSAPGDTILVMDGEYVESVQIKNTGTADGWITFKSMNRHGAKITNTWGNAIYINQPIGYIIIDGFELVAPAVYGSGAKSSNGAHHITVRNCWAHHCGESGISLNDGDYRVVEYNIVHDNSWLMPLCGSGISLYGLVPFDDAPGFHSIVRGNISFNNDNGPDTHKTDGNGIIIDDFRNIQEWHQGGAVKDINYTGKETLVENNLVFNNGGYGINVFLSNNVTLRNNTSFHNLTRRDATTWRGEFNISCSKNITLVNNIGVANSNPRMDGGETDFPTFSHNTAIGAFGLTGDMFGAEYYFYNNITFDTDKPTSNSIQTSGVTGVLASIVNANGNLVATNPLFVSPGIDAETNDFRLTAESPAINAGHQTNFAPFDIIGQPRPVGTRPDIGAYEYPVDLGVNVPFLDPAIRKLEFFPNPVKSVLTVSLNQTGGDVLVRVFSISGKEVFNQRVASQSGNCEINVESIQAGVYFLKIENSGNDTVSKFVKL